ncbi:MAG: GTP-binding protein, partial [Rubrivivax sp.]
MNTQIRNIAIIAHVDHGKTTLVDQLLRQSGTFSEHEKVAERVMDSNDLERERGITILAKNCAVSWQGTHINIVDTPGHADFGGEVERVLSMVDGVLLLVDAVEGPMPQTRFVTKKALAQGLKPIVVVNKVDRPGSRIDHVINATFDLFDKLGATEEQLDFPVVYASGLNGWATLQPGETGTDLAPLFDCILRHVPPHSGSESEPLQLQICSLDYSSYVGRIGIGRIHNGELRPGQDVAVYAGIDGPMRKARVNQVLKFEGLARVPAEKAGPGDIVLVNGIENIGIGETLTSLETPTPLPMLVIDEPTLTMNFCVNTSPLAGREGKFVTSRQIRDRLDRELQSNVALRVTDTAAGHPTAAYGTARLSSILADLPAAQADSMVAWWKQVIEVLQSASHSDDFYQKATRALVESVGLDVGAVYVIEGDTWVPKALLSTGSYSTRPSTSVLGTVRETRRTFHQRVAAS